MRWNKISLRNSFFGWLGSTASARQPIDPKERLEEIRQMMLGKLGDIDSDERAQLGCKISLATDIPTLWYARSALMHAVADRVGEAQARVHMNAITHQFDGLVVPRHASRGNRKR